MSTSELHSVIIYSFFLITENPSILPMNDYKRAFRWQKQQTSNRIINSEIIFDPPFIFVSKKDAVVTA